MGGAEGGLAARQVPCLLLHLFHCDRAENSSPGKEDEGLVGGGGESLAVGQVPCSLLHLFHCDRAEYY